MMKNKYLLIICLLLMFLAMLSITFFVIYYQNSVCLRNPLQYGAKDLVKKYGYEVVGIVYFKIPLELHIKPPIIYFNSSDVILKK